MVYLDYSATTPVDEEVLDTFVLVEKKYIGNPNSLHKLGIEANKLIRAATKQISELLKIKENEIIYTSGASEANNMAIKGIVYKYKNRGNHIITTDLEHSSISEVFEHLKDNGFIIDVVKTTEFGIIDLEHLKQLLNDKTILVSINKVNSEIGINQNINEIGLLLNNYQKCFFHVDMTQALGKVAIDLTNVDLASFSAHKIYGIKGIGMLYKKENIVIDPLIEGGKSTTIFRSGTPVTSLIVAFSKAIRLVLSNLDENYLYVKKLSDYLKESLKKYDNVFVNSNEYCLPHIVNISIIDIKSETLLHSLEEYDIYISTKTACSNGSASKTVYELTKDIKKSNSSVRISLSHLTTKEEIDYFLKCFDKVINNLKLK